MKCCAKCHIEKPPEAFYVRKSGDKAGQLTSSCRDCTRHALAVIPNRRPPPVPCSRCGESIGRETRRRGVTICATCRAQIKAHLGIKTKRALI
jgi:hypothetical protein